MRITVGTESKSLPEILGWEYQSFTSDKENQFYKLTLQNLWSVDIFIENGSHASVDTGYMLKTGNEVEITTKYINKLHLVSQGAENDNIRIITN